MAQNNNKTDQNIDNSQPRTYPRSIYLKVKDIGEEAKVIRIEISKEEERKLAPRLTYEMEVYFKYWTVKDSYTIAHATQSAIDEIEKLGYKVTILYDSINKHKEAKKKYKETKVKGKTQGLEKPLPGPDWARMTREVKKKLLDSFKKGRRKTLPEIPPEEELIDLKYVLIILEIPDKTTPHAWYGRDSWDTFGSVGVRRPLIYIREDLIEDFWQKGFRVLHVFDKFDEETRNSQEFKDIINKFNNE